MGRLGVVVSVVALAVAAWLATEVSSLQGRLDQQADEITALRTLATAPDRAQPIAAQPSLAAPAAPGTEEPAAGPVLTAPAWGGAESLQERLAALERRIEKQERDGTTAKSRSGNAVELLGKAHGFVHDADSAAKAWNLDDRQRSQVEDRVARARQELDALREIPNDEGLTWNEAAKVKWEGNPESGMLAIGTNLARLEGFKRGKVPGRSETYGEADRRIRRQAKEDLRRLLTPDQQAQFDRTHVDPLLGPGSGGGFTAISVATIEESGD